MTASMSLFEKYKNKQEGDLTKIRAAVVCEKALSKFAAKIGLGDYMYLGHGEEINNGRKRPSITADAFEALLAAVYIDSGENFDEVGRFLLPFIADEIEFITETGVFVDYKTTLQEIIQQNPGEMLEYVLTGESGPDHNKQFTVQVFLNSNIIGTGRGRSKKDAEQQAAKEALALMGYR